MENDELSPLLHHPDLMEFRIPEITNLVWIGAGRQATVLKGISDDYGEVAIKYFKEREMIKEIEMLKSIPKHPNIVHLYGLLKDSKSPTCAGYVMEFMSGGSLDTVIHNKTLHYDMSQIRTWVHQICLGLQHLHKRKILHRDMKPLNILLGSTLNDLKISDFGSARTLDQESYTAGVGSNCYMAPEVILSLKYGREADIYGLAIITWEIIHRRKPYEHLENLSNFETIKRILEGERPQLGDQLNPAICAFLQNGWEKKPSNRPSIKKFIELTKVHMNKDAKLNESMANEYTEVMAKASITIEATFRSKTGGSFLPTCLKGEDNDEFKVPKAVAVKSLAKDSDRSMKCIILGSGGVGKTVLLIRYITGKYPEEYIPTVFDNYTVDVTDPKTDDQFTFYLYDTAGQDEYDPIRHLAYSAVDAFIICFSVAQRDSFEAVSKKWLPEVQKYAPGIPIILVATMTDTRNPNCFHMRPDVNLVSFSEGAKKAKEIGAFAYRECSSVLGEGVKGTFDTLLEVFYSKNKPKGSNNRCCLL